MTGYTFRSAGANSSTLTGGNMTPALPAGLTSGDLMVLHTGVNSISLGRPTVSGWTLVTPHTNENGDAIYVRIAGSSESSPTFQWDASHQAFARIAAFTGSVYTTVGSIVEASSDRQVNSTLGVLINSVTIAHDNCLVLRGGHYIKSATNNGSSFGDWSTNSGIFTKISTDIMQNGGGIGATWWYFQQASATSYGQDTSPITTPDTNNNSQGWTLALLSTDSVTPSTTVSSTLIFILP